MTLNDLKKDVVYLSFAVPFILLIWIPWAMLATLVEIGDVIYAKYRKQK